MIRLILLGTEGCHLCEEAEWQIKQAVALNEKLSVERIDIADEEQWQAQYALRIPVLFHVETQNALCWPFDQSDISKFIADFAIHPRCVG